MEKIMSSEKNVPFFDNNRLNALPNDLRQLYLRTPLYSIEWLEDIARFRNYSVNEKKGAWMVAWDGRPNYPALLSLIEHENFSYIYQSYKEELCSLDRLQECLKDAQEGKGIVLETLLSQNGLTLIRKGRISIEYILGLSQRGWDEQGDPEHFEDRLKVLLLDESTFQKVISEELTVENVMSFSYEKIHEIQESLNQKITNVI
jgi:hypothetical protein